MKKYLPWLFLFQLLAFTFCSRNEVEVNIEVISNNLPDSSSIYITGNDDNLGNWQPDSVELDKIETDKWSKSFFFQRGKKLEFKITRGSWANEALNNDGSIPSNYSMTVANDTLINIHINLWADQVHKKNEGQITGTVEYHRNFQGEGLKPRDIIVWLPPGYNSDLDKYYPVLYLHDGQNIIDPFTSSFKVDWQIDETADSLIRQSKIKPIIIVGIYNTSDRNDEYSDNKFGFAYMDFVIDSLKPFIDRNYRTKPDKENTANGGASLGGLIAFIFTWEHPDKFSKAICFSPAFKIDQYNFVDNVKSNKHQKKDIRIYIYNGDNELDSNLQPGVEQMIDELKEQGYKQPDNYYFYKGINAQHGERDWAKNIGRALIYLFGTEFRNNLL
jgi:predicted alpha/beta superfamily hydrolase